MEDFGGNLSGRSINHSQKDSDAIREATRLYRETWLAPLLNLVEQRLCGKKG